MKELESFSFQNLQMLATEFSSSLEDFLTKHPEITPLIENKPVDHLAIKSHYSKDYEEYIKTIKSHVQKPFLYTHMDQRRIAAAKLTDSINFSPFGFSNMIEIIEPKPEKAKTTDARFDHIEFLNPDLETIEHILSKHLIPFTRYQNPKHKALVVVINDKGQEIKFTDSRLKDIVLQEFNEKNATEITD